MGGAATLGYNAKSGILLVLGFGRRCYRGDDGRAYVRSINRRRFDLRNGGRDLGRLSDASSYAKSQKSKDREY